MEEEDILQLGGNIELSGFSELDGGMMIILKKIVGNYAKKMSDHSTDFEKLHVTMKTIHSTEKNKKFEIKARLHYNGSVVAGDNVDRNVFVAVDNSLKIIMSSFNN